jgi:hypothetical protein
MPTYDTAIEKNYEDMPTISYRTGDKTCDPNLKHYVSI